MPGRSAVRVRAWFALVKAEIMAALTVAVIFVGSGVARHWAPYFGTQSRSTNDLGTQFVPMHAHLRDLLTLQGGGDFFLNWRSGFGVPFLPDYYTYLASPFSLLVVLFPRDQMDGALLVITTLKFMAAAVAMVVFLKRVGAGPWWLLGMLGAAYGLCGWAVNDSTYAPMWIDGLVFLPLLALAASWRMDRKHFVPSVLIVLYGWWANFYVAYMATIAVGLIVLAQLAIRRLGTRETVAALVRVAVPILCGIALLTPLLLTTFLATRTGQPGYGSAAQSSSIHQLMSRVLPMSEGVGPSASVYVSTLALLLVCSLPFHTKVPLRERVTWSALPILVALSFWWMPTAVVWHFFDEPDGSRYRMGFVLCAILVMVAWQAVRHGLPDWKALGGGAAVIGLVVAYSHGSDLISRWALPVLAATLAATVAMLLLVGRRPQGVVALLAVLAAFGAFSAEELATAYYVDHSREKRMPAVAAWSAEHDRRAELLRNGDGFPDYRSDPGVPDIVNNDPMLLGGEGSAYYSSLIPEVTWRTLWDLGYPGHTRTVLPHDNPVLDTIFSIGARVDASGLSRLPSLPLVTTRDQPLSAALPGGGSPFQRQEAILGESLYSYPEFTVTDSAGTREMKTFEAFTFTEGSARLRTSCPAGQELYVWLPAIVGWIDVAGDRFDPSGKGIISAGGQTDFEMAIYYPSLVSETWAACLDRARLQQAFDRLKGTAATSVSVTGHTLSAQVRPETGAKLAVVAVTDAPGWSCRSGVDWAPPVNFGGLIGVELVPGASRIECRFQPAGLVIGAAGSGVALVITIGLAVWDRRRTRVVTAQ